MTASPPMVELRGVTLRHGATTALDDVSLRLEGGSICGLIGRNGSGKSSLLSILAGFRRATRGAVLVGGVPVFENAAATSKICLIRDDLDTVDSDCKVQEALDFAAVIRPGWDAGRAAALLDRFSLDPGKEIGALSRGRRAALSITLGLASSAPLTMFDESYVNMDAPTRQIFYDELLAAADGSRTFVLATHLIDEAGALFEEVVLLDRGRVALHEEADELRSRGCTVTGRAEAVERFVAGRPVLGEKTLGATRSVMLYGGLDDDRRSAAAAAGLDLGPVGLQELVVHLTDPARSPR